MALVTGAARGIGAEVAERLARDGYHIAAVDVTAAARRKAVNAASWRTYVCDVRDWDALENTISTVEDGQGPIAVAACVAGIWVHRPFLELAPETWREVIDVNLLGTFQVSRLAATRMAQRREGSIICIASTAASFAWHGGSHYSASKAGVCGLVRAMALELGPLGIRANAVSPGTILTPATEAELKIPQVAERQAMTSPLRRVGSPIDVAEAVSFLADPVRAAWITGAEIVVDGGYSVHGEEAGFGEVLGTTTPTVGDAS